LHILPTCSATYETFAALVLAFEENGITVDSFALLLDALFLFGAFRAWKMTPKHLVEFYASKSSNPKCEILVAAPSPYYNDQSNSIAVVDHLETLHDPSLTTILISKENL
jgi:acetyl-CoA acetyltransferase